MVSGASSYLIGSLLGNRARLHRFHAEKQGEGERDERGQRRRREHIAAPMIVHPDASHRDEERQDEQRNPVPRKEKRQRKKESPEMRSVAGREGTAAIAKKFPIPVASLDDLKRSQPIKNILERASG
jgi:hypothetical protein